MKIYALRHGLTELNKLGKANGQTIIDPLSEEGKKQAEDIVPNIPVGIDMIYSSDLLRAYQTADIINKHLNVEIFRIPELREVDFGSLVGKSWEEMNNFTSIDILNVYRKQQYDFRPWGGESFEDVKKRVTTFLDKIKSTQLEKKVLIITHGGIVRLLQFLYKDITHNEAIKNLMLHEFEV